MKFKWIILILLLEFISFNLNAQYIEDAGLWSKFNIEKKITRSFSFNLNQEARFNENITRPNTFFTEFGTTYKNKGFKVSATYRFAQKKLLSGFYSFRHRYYFDLQFRFFKIKKVSLTNRIRYQSQYEDYYTSLRGKIPENYLRDQLVLKMELPRKIKPYVAGEIFYRLKDLDIKEPEIITKSKRNKIDNWRGKAGVNYEFNLRNSLGIFYMIQQEMNVKRPVRDYIAGIEYNISF